MKDGPIHSYHWLLHLDMDNGPAEMIEAFDLVDFCKVFSTVKAISDISIEAWQHQIGILMFHRPRCGLIESIFLY